MENLLAFITSKAFYESLIVIVVLALILTFIKRFLIKKVAYAKRKKGDKKNTLLGLIFNILQYVVIITSIFVILTVNGVNVTGMLAGLGVAATIIGLSLQDTFKDLFAGINIYNNNYYKVGDYVKYNGETCEVKYFNARVTKFRSITTDASYTVSNSNISSIEKVKEEWSINLLFDFDVDKKKVDKCLQAATLVGEKHEGSKAATYYGLTNMTKEGCTYTIGFRAAVDKQFAIKLAIFNTAYDEFKKAKIAPATDNDISVKSTKKSK